MLDINDAHGQLKYGGIWRYLFYCVTCDTEIKVIRSRVQTHSGLCANCNRRQSKNHKEPFKYLYNILKVQAATRNIPISLTFDEFLLFTEIEICRYCGNGIKWYPRSRQGSHATNLDRIDSSKGYEFDNIAVCCFNCNDKKSNWLTGDEFQLVNDLLRLYRSLSAQDKKELEYAILSWEN